MSAYICAHQPERGFQCPKCGRGKLKVVAGPPRVWLCVICGFRETEVNVIVEARKDEAVN